LLGCEHCSNSSIPHKPTAATNSVAACDGQATDSSLPQAEIDTATWCTAGEESWQSEPSFDGTSTCSSRPTTAHKPRGT
ncbi:hypothetical protein IscW_ISCW005612, partial [Ixodes scapularis]